MDYSISGFSYLIFFLALGFLAYRFFQYWKKERNLISKLWLYIIIQVEIFTLTKVVGGLFFSTNRNFLEMTMDIAAVVEAFIFATLAYLIVYIKLPKISPWFGFIPVFIVGLIASVFTIMSPFNPYLEVSAAINWGTPSGPFVFSVFMVRFILALAIIIPIIIIFFQQFKASENIYVKRKSIGLFLSLMLGLLIGLLDFFLVSSLRVDPIWRDISFIAIGIVLFITLIFTMPRPRSESPYYIKNSKDL